METRGAPFAATDGAVELARNVMERGGTPFCEILGCIPCYEQHWGVPGELTYCRRLYVLSEDAVE